MLRNYALHCGKNVDSDITLLDQFTNGNTVSSYAKESVAWAIQEGLISGLFQYYFFEDILK